MNKRQREKNFKKNVHIHFSKEDVKLDSSIDLKDVRGLFDKIIKNRSDVSSEKQHYIVAPDDNKKQKRN